MTTVGAASRCRAAAGGRHDKSGSTATNAVGTRDAGAATELPRRDERSRINSPGRSASSMRPATQRSRARRPTSSRVRRRASRYPADAQRRAQRDAERAGRVHKSAAARTATPADHELQRLQCRRDDESAVGRRSRSPRSRRRNRSPSHQLPSGSALTASINCPGGSTAANVTLTGATGPSPLTFTVNAISAPTTKPPPAVACTITVVGQGDGSLASLSIPVNVTSTGIGVSAHRRKPN